MFIIIYLLYLDMYYMKIAQNNSKNKVNNKILYN